MINIHGEEIIRRIVREELKKLLESTAETARNSDGYETGELESAALGAINKVVESEAYLLPHAWDCTRRIGDYFERQKCSCGVGMEDKG